MNAYSEDLRKKILQVLGRGATKTEAARAFGASRSSVKRYARLAEQGRPLAPKKRPGSEPKMDERARKLLEADLEERPSATLSDRSEYLGRVAGVSVSDSTASRVLKRLGWSRKKIVGSGRARRVPEGRMAAAGRRAARRGSAGVRGRDGGQRIFVSHLRLVATRGAGLEQRPAQLGQERHAAGQHNGRGRRPVPGGRGGDDARGLRGLPGAGSRPRTEAGAGGGDGQPCAGPRRAPGRCSWRRWGGRWTRSRRATPEGSSATAATARWTNCCNKRS